MTIPGYVQEAPGSGDVVWWFMGDKGGAGLGNLEGLSRP